MSDSNIVLTHEETMVALLLALMSKNEDLVNEHATNLFVNRDGRVNRAAVSEFERYAPCKIGPGERDSFGWLTGVIQYNDCRYIFG